MKALITGISGHLGPHLAKILLENGYDVRGLVRSQSNLKSLENLKVKLFKGDILDCSSLEKAMVECDFVFHLAAPTTVRTAEDRLAVLD